MTPFDGEQSDMFQMTSFGYVSTKLAKTGSDDVVGGILVMDPYGDPAEFIVTDPIPIKWPTRVLFGNRLMGYLGSCIVAPTLVKSVKSKLALLCFDEPSLLLRRVDLGIPVVVSAPDSTAFNGRYWIKISGLDANHEQTAWWAQSAAADQARLLLDKVGQILAPGQKHEPFTRLQEALKDGRRSSATD